MLHRETINKDLIQVLQTLTMIPELESFRLPHISMKSILFALGEVDEAEKNKSVMPEMLLPVSWKEINSSMLAAARSYVQTNYGLGETGSEKL